MNEGHPRRGRFRARMRRVGARRLSILPNAITLGNSVCGFASIVRSAKGDFVGAAWLILMGMVFDALDGRVARLTRSAGNFGKELDSLADVVTFGVAPAQAVALMNSATGGSALWPKIIWFFSLVFALGATLRLARFNVEAGLDDASHDRFKGLPSPGAAGVIASLIVLADHLRRGDDELLGYVLNPQTGARIADGIGFLLPACALIMGYLMVSSRVTYPHLVNRLFRGRKTFDYLADLIVVVLLAAIVPEVAIAFFFVAYSILGPTSFVVGLFKPAPAPEGEPQPQPERPA